MSTITESLKLGSKPWLPVVALAGVLLLAAALAVPNLHRMSAPTAVPQRYASLSGAVAGPASQSIRAIESDMTSNMVSEGRGTALPSSSDSGRAETKAKGGSAGKIGILPDRKIIQTGALELVVKNPPEAAEQIRMLAENLGGYLESAQIGGSKEASMATLTIRVPVARFEEAKAGVRKLAAHVESERTDAQDVTRQYVDMEARLRNLRAEEAQYLTILKSAYKVDDLLNVSEKLSEVRGEIEQQQAEFQALSRQIEMVTINIGLRAEVDTQVFGLNWRPLYQVKVAARNGLEALAEFGLAMIAIVFYVPVVVAWSAAILLAVFAGWRLLRLVGKIFSWPKAEKAAV